MRSVSFTIPGRLKGWARARINSRGGKPIVFKDRQTASHQGLVQHYASEAMRGHHLLVGPLTLEVQISLNTPKSWSKKKKAATRYVTGTPDCDNLIKLIADACNGVLYRDDSEFAEIRLMRRYDDAAPESVFVSVGELFDGPPILERPRVSRLAEAAA
jgi:Holliday junction resolvase RusA-like endonuclease